MAIELHCVEVSDIISFRRTSDVEIQEIYETGRQLVLYYFIKMKVTGHIFMSGN